MNYRTFARIVLFSMLAAVLVSMRGHAVAQVTGQRGQTRSAQPTRVVTMSGHHGVSLPVRDLPRLTTFDNDAEAHEPLPLPNFRNMARNNRVRVADRARQSAQPQPLVLANPILNFDGVPVGGGGVSPIVAPPDTNGAVGLTQYVEMVNLAYAVYNKSDGSLVAGPTATNVIWTGFGGDCEMRNDGDPVVLYDQLADRWIITQLSIGPFRTGVGDFLQCMAVSTSGDATGTYNLYAFDFGPDDFDDYGKFSVWPDGIYGNFNIFNRTGTAFKYGKECAFDRSAMEAGTDAAMVCFNTPMDAGFLSSNLDGATLPPDGAPNPFVEIWDVGPASSLAIWPFHVDFAVPDNSTFGPPVVLSVAPFNRPGSVVPQLGTTQKLDTLGDRMMFRLAYRNFGDHESLVANHSVGDASQVSVRWYEIQDPNGSPVVFQQGTFAPDAAFRWMGSIAMDKVGNIAMGYSASSSEINPALRFTGRVPSDDPGTMEDEAELFAGMGSQGSPTMPLSRWGDYSSLNVDPTDDCTFYYATEYIPIDGRFNWNTRIASFVFPSCPVAMTTSASAQSVKAPGSALSWKPVAHRSTGSTGSAGRTSGARAR